MNVLICIFLLVSCASCGRLLQKSRCTGHRLFPTSASSHFSLSGLKLAKSGSAIDLASLPSVFHSTRNSANMPQYRIEISPNNRAGCNDTVCKKEGVKIFKNEIRFGTWVEIQDRGSWKWKHWGCVSGSQIAGLQESCGGDPDNYDFDAIDGFDELNDEDVKEKVRRCVKQGHIDAEDFKGDPEKNKLGEKGIYLSAKEKAAKEKAAAKDAGEDEAPAKANKRGGKKAADVADEPKTKRAKKSKNVEADEEPPKAKSKAKAKAKDATEEDAGESASAKRGRPRRSITQQDEEVEDEEAEAPAPAKKATKKGSKAKAAQEQQPEEETVEEDEVEEKEEVKATPARAARGRKTAASKAKTATTDKDEDATTAAPASAPRGRKRAAATKTDDAEEDEPKPLVKRGRKSSTPAKKSAPEPAEEVEAEVDTPKAAPKVKGRGRPRKSDASTA